MVIKKKKEVRSDFGNRHISVIDDHTHCNLSHQWHDVNDMTSTYTICRYKCSIEQITSRYFLVHNSKQPWYNFLLNFSSGNDKVVKMCKAYASLIYIVLAYRHTFKMAAPFLPTGSLLIICGVCKCPRDLKYTLLQQLWAQREGRARWLWFPSLRCLLVNDVMAGVVPMAAISRETLSHYSKWSLHPFNTWQECKII